MRKLVLCLMQTLDGYTEGPNGELGWHNVDEEYNDFAVEQLNSADILLFGRKTFELMQNYWATEQALNDDPIVAEKMNSIHKIVCSQTLQKVTWNNSLLVGENTHQVITTIKSQPGKNILIFGSTELASSILNLIDEFHLIINPVCIGGGKTLLSTLHQQVDLQLLQTHEFESGKLLLKYRPITNTK